MAIKGKGKTRSHPPARAPRRAPVERPTPFLQRRWVQLVAAVLVGAGVVWFLIWLTNGIRQGNVDEREAVEQVERRRAVRGWKELVETEIAKVGAFGAPGAAPSVAAELPAVIEIVADGEDDVSAIDGLDERLDEAASALEGYDLIGAVRNKGFDVGEASAVLDSQAGFVSALRSYAVAARLTTLAATLPDAGHEATIDEARSVSEGAATTLQGAWNDYLLGLNAGGLTPASAGAEAGLGTGGLPIGG
ncbi:MAG TPA: hypothetical protein VLA82_12815 [Actinomycetota bacterium]|nr:hypothetical protein [Actinomycetota bacterium]